MINLRRYFIMGSQDCPKNQSPESILQAAIRGGITAFQFREKGVHALSGVKKIALGKELRQLCKKNHIPFIVNDDVELVHELQADGIHVGQDDPSVSNLRKKFPHLIIGLSISNFSELEKSKHVLPLINYIGAGTIYPTTSKSDAKQAVGLQWIRDLRNRHPQMPIVGIGGIQVNNAKDVINAGADGIAVISAITKASNIHAIVKQL